MEFKKSSYKYDILYLISSERVFFPLRVDEAAQERLLRSLLLFPGDLHLALLCGRIGLFPT